MLRRVGSLVVATCGKRNSPASLRGYFARRK